MGLAPLPPIAVDAGAAPATAAYAPAQLLNWVYLSLAESSAMEQPVAAPSRPPPPPRARPPPPPPHASRVGMWSPFQQTVLAPATAAPAPATAAYRPYAAAHPSHDTSEVDLLCDRVQDLSLAINLGRPKRCPPRPYMCHRCFLPDHYIKDCPQARPKEEGQKTPYQGKKRCFGEYKCSKCKRKWMSGNSWANIGQKCIKCHILVYPHKQRPLDKPDGLDVSDQSKLHPHHLCEKCTSLNFYCRRQQKVSRDPPLPPNIYISP